MLKWSNRQEKENISEAKALPNKTTTTPFYQKISDSNSPKDKMVVKQEGGALDIKADPDANSPPMIKTEDGLKSSISSVPNSLESKVHDTKIKVEMSNGIASEDIKHNISDTNPSSMTGTNNTSPQNPDAPDDALVASESSSGPTKGCGAGVATSDAQYMQQQSQIFVFTTELANAAAEQMISGQVQSIVNYHLALPATKKLLEKHPVKLNQFGRSNQINWMGTMAKGNKSMKPHMSNNIRMPEMNSSSSSSCIGEGNMPNMMSNCGSGPMSMNGPSMMGPSMMGPSSRPPGMMMHPNGGPGMGVSMMGAMSCRMTGDENLTPEQRMHREGAMAKIRSIGAMFLNSPPSETQNPPPQNNPLNEANPSQCSNPPTGMPLTTPPVSTSCSTGSNSANTGLADSIFSSSVPGTTTTSTSTSPIRGGPCSTSMSIPCPMSNGPTLDIPSSTFPGSTPGTQPSTAALSSCAMSGNPPLSISSGPMSNNPQSQMGGTQSMMGSMGPSPVPRMGPSPVPRMGPSPSLGHSPNMGPSPGMPPGQGMSSGPNMSSGPGMGPNMNQMSMMNMGMGPNMMGPGPGSNMMGPGMGSGMMMGQGPMGNGMMMPQPNMMGGPMGPGCPPNMRMMGPGNPMMMGGPGGPVDQMNWQRSMHDHMDSKRKKVSHNNSMGPDPHMMMMGNSMMPNHMMGGPMHGGMPMGSGMRPMGGGPGNRMQGPPPPYHGPGPRPMGNGPLQSPGSPSMHSPRMPNNCGGPGSSMRMGGPPSGMDSPRPMISNPSTPGHAPSPAMKDQPPTPQSMAPDMPFGRGLTPFDAQKGLGMNNPAMGGPGSQSITSMKETSLMPVPSPKQISYLNSLECQELTIQKQPNTSLRDNDILSPMQNNMESLGGSTDIPTSMGNRASCPTTPQGGPTTPATPFGTGATSPDRFPIPSPGMASSSTPHTPNTQENRPTSRFTNPSPQSQISNNNPVPSSAPASCSSNASGPKTPSIDTSRFPVPSPKTSGMCPTSQTGDPGSQFTNSSPLHSVGLNNMAPMSRFGPANTPTSSGMLNQQNKIPPFSHSPGKMPLEIPSDLLGGSSNVPLNPNCTTTSAMPTPTPSGKGLDPISSMAQMSQQLTSGQSGSPPISSAATPTLPGGSVTMGNVPPNMIESPGGMMGMPAVSSSPGMLGGPVPSPVNGGGPRGGSPGTLGMMGTNPRMMGPSSNPRPNGPNSGIHSPFNGANVQVKPNAPNTIQYLPARAQANAGPGGPRPPHNMDFMTRMPNAPNMDKCSSPMFPNSTTPNSMVPSNVGMPSMSMGGGPCGPMNVQGSGMCPSGQMNGPVGPMGGMGGPGGNMSSPFPMPGPNGPMPGMGGPMGPGGPMMGPNGPGPHMMGPMGMNPSMMSNGPMGPNGQMMGPRVGSHMMRGPNPNNIMPPMGGEMYGMNGPGGNMSGGPGPGHPGQNQMMPGSGPMFPNKGSPGGMCMPMGGPQDTAQPLPPSMGQSGNFKNSPYMAPTTTDPNYAAQYHNFQQQLYATSSRGGHMGHMSGPMSGPMGPGPGMQQSHGPPMMPTGHMGHQGFPYQSK